jgi:hypothetical protein
MLLKLIISIHRVKSLSPTLHLRSLLVTVVVSVLALASRALSGAAPLNVTVDLGPQGVVQDTQSDFGFSGLNGTPFQGQSLSFDLIFSGDEFIRLFTATAFRHGSSGPTYGQLSFDFLVLLQTNHAGFLSFPTATGYIFDQSKNPLITPQSSGGGSASGPDPLRVGFGIFPFISLSPQTLPLDFYGAHFDVNFPVSPNTQVTGGTLRLVNFGGVYGIGPGVPADVAPDAGNSLVLFTAGLMTIGAVKRIKRFSINSEV